MERWFYPSYQMSGGAEKGWAAHFFSRTQTKNSGSSG